MNNRCSSSPMLRGEVGRSLGRCTGLLWSEEDALQSVRAMGGERHLARDVRSAGGSGWNARRSPDRQQAYEGAPLGGRRKKGGGVQAIGISEAVVTASSPRLPTAKGALSASC